MPAPVIAGEWRYMPEHPPWWVDPMPCACAAFSIARDRIPQDADGVCHMPEQCRPLVTQPPRYWRFFPVGSYTSPAKRCDRPSRQMREIEVRNLP